MPTPTKSYYKIGEVSRMLGVPAYTLQYWEREFDELRPARVNNQRRYAHADVEIVKRIMELLREQGLRIGAAREALRGHTVSAPMHAPDRCKSAKGAIRLLTEALMRINDPSARVRVENVLQWLLDTEKQTDSPT